MNTSATVADALAGARYQAPRQSRHRTVLIAGAAGRLGERILAQALAAQDYQRIYVLTSDAMPSTEAKLTALRQSDWTETVDDVIAVVGENDQEAARSTPGRTGIFSKLTADQIMPLALHAKSLGVSRFMLVTPTNILLRPSAVYAQLSNLMEADLHQVGFEALLLVRPSDHQIRQRQKVLPARVLGLLIDTVTGLMAGAKHAPLSIESVARAAVRALRDSGPGLSILEPDRLRQLIKS
jgi:uncharacterized protein YbjT (DUF2867 family)